MFQLLQEGLILFVDDEKIIYHFYTVFHELIPATFSPLFFQIQDKQMAWQWQDLTYPLNLHVASSNIIKFLKLKISTYILNCQLFFIKKLNLLVIKFLSVFLIHLVKSFFNLLSLILANFWPKSAIFHALTLSNDLKLLLLRFISFSFI